MADTTSSTDSIEDQVGVDAPQACRWFPSTREVRCVVGVVLFGYFNHRQCIVRVLRLVAVCVCVAWKVSVCHWFPLGSSQASWSDVHVCLRPCSSTSRWPKLSTHRPHLDEQSVLSRPLGPRCPCMCFIAKELAILKRLAHAAEHSHFFGALRAGG